MKNSLLFSIILLSVFGLNACYEDASKVAVTNLCEGTGGKLQNGKCVCSGETCENVHWCDSNGKCSSDVELTPDLLCVASGGKAKDDKCICSDEACKEGFVCNLSTKKCPEAGHEPGTGPGSQEVTFELACKASGGESAGGICVCNGAGCSRGVICNFNTKNCADTGIQKGDSCSGNGSQCNNNDDLEGQLIACNGTTYETSECKDSSGNPVSCHQDKCGTCINYTNQCINQLNEKREEIGVVQECQEGVPGKTIAMCSDVSCRADIPSCGECINGALKCTEDNDNNAIMYRCVNGRWERIRNRLDPIDPDYACPDSCREGTDPQKMENECDRSQCDKCDPCWGEPMVGAPFNPNPCYDEAKCKALIAAEDPDYPPFRDWDTTKRLNDTRTQKIVSGYDFTDHSAVSKPEERVHDFPLDLTNGKRRVSCLADGSRYGICHNSLQVCINEEYHGKGYIIQCSHGALAEYPPCSNPEDPNCKTKGDGIACHCERLGTQNANGCCYTRSSCFKNTTATSGPALCAKPNPNGDEGYGEYEGQ